MSDNSNQIKEQEIEAVEEDVSVEETEAQEASPPGYKTYDEYIADGGDPDLYKGRKAYSKHYELIQEVKRSRNDYKDLSDNINTVLEQQKAMITEQYETQVADLKTKLAAQKEDMDVNGALNTQKQIDRIERQKEKAIDNAERQAEPVNDNANVLVEFINDNPEINQNHPNFDRNLFERVQSLVAQGERPNMTPRQVETLLSKSLLKAMASTATKEKQPRKARTTGQKPSKSVQSTKADPSKLDGAARNIYDHLLAAKRTKAAERFLNNQLGANNG